MHGPEKDGGPVSGLQGGGSTAALVKNPNAARIYDYLIGGKDNLARERNLGDRLMAGIPGLEDAAQANRRFAAAAVKKAAEMGVAQFVDLGCGLPAVPYVHEIAQALVPAARVTYVDNDLLVMSHATNTLASGNGKNSAVRAVTGDISEPEIVLKALAAESLVDFRRPVALIMAAVLHFIPSPLAGSIMRVYRDALPPGSVLGISHLTGDGWEDEETGLLAGVCEEAGAEIFLRDRKEIAELFGGLNLTAPGLADVVCYAGPAGGTRHPIRAYAGIGIGRERAANESLPGPVRKTSRPDMRGQAERERPGRRPGQEA